MDYRQLKYFLAVCSTSNMTAAASVENVSEQALSKAIRNLERELGAKLFARVPRGVEMTREGLELQAEAAAYVRRHDELLGRFSARGSSRARLNLAMATGTLALWFREDFLAEFVLQRPDLDLNVSFFSEDIYNHPADRGSFDLIVGTRPGSGETIFHARRAMRLAMSESDELAKKGTVQLPDLLGRTLACAIEETPEQLAMIGKLKEAGCPPMVRFGPSEISFINDLLRAGRVIVPFAGDEDRLGPGIVARDVEGLGVTWNLYGTVAKNRTLQPVARDLIASMKKELNASEP